MKQAAQLLRQSAGEGSQPPLCSDIASVPNALAEAAPNAPLFECVGRVWSRLQFADLTLRCASTLVTQHGIKPFDRVAYLGLNHPHQMALLFALARIGAVLVPLNWRLASAEWRALMTDCRPTLLLTDSTWLPQASALASGCEVPCALLADAAAASPRPLPNNSIFPLDTPALLVYTSGTTGQPKGAVHTHGHLLANMKAATAAMQLQADDVIATVLPLFHVGGLCIHTLPALWCGARVLMAPRFDTAQTLAWAHTGRFTQLLMVPAAMRALVEHSDWANTDWQSVRGVWAGSSNLPNTLIEAFHARGVSVGNVYGATETGPVSLVLPLHQAASHLGSSGFAAPMVEVVLAPLTPLTPLAALAPLASIANDAARPLSATTTGTPDRGQTAEGEIWVRGPNVIDHYWPNIPACNSDGFFHTGDIGRMGADGDITVIGRCKDLVISGGENIYPAEIEAILLNHGAVADCAVVGVPDAHWGEVLVAVVTPKNLEIHDRLNTTEETGTLSNSHGVFMLPKQERFEPKMMQLERALSNHLAAHLAAYKLPRHWLWSQTLPKTALGKVQKSVLRDAVLKRLVDFG